MFCELISERKYVHIIITEVNLQNNYRSLDMSMISDAVMTADNEIQRLAISSVPMQESCFENLFSAEESLVKGTVFPELYLPFCRERGAR